MKTETLIELQRNIPSGPFEYYPHHPLKGEKEWIVGKTQLGTNNVLSFATCYTSDMATAIALVPELIAEVIRLREALRDCLNRLDERDEQSAPECLAARAALVNDK